ncbi:aldo/keto reductase [Synechococcus sp. NB0720_010]|uniref:aldo/keto reductase n=1 Tax=Synechococcus sp. NB0720_010 TaxID=2907159 RepID=UPI001FF71185|nr:aldo/keto reductase [Synechococcus sp. NB0720_010]UPH89125.1 aldo/keto reductase [Synechococcus sp. NB0720_010]
MSRLVFGTGGRFGRLSRSLAQSLVDHAWERGIRIFDTGMSYCHGRSQSLLLECLSDRISHPSCLISTKIPADPLYIPYYLDLCRSAFALASLDLIFLWGPTFEELNNQDLALFLKHITSSGIVRRLGVNTHDLRLMRDLDQTACFPYVSDLMIDFSLAQPDRSPVILKYSSLGVKVWAGTSLAQGFLLESPFERYIRTRSISYLLRYLFNAPTRQLSSSASPIRRYLRRTDPASARSLPLAYVLNHPSISYVPIGMLSKNSIDHNISIEDRISSYSSSLDQLNHSLPSLLGSLSYG